MKIHVVAREKLKGYHMKFSSIMHSRLAISLYFPTNKYFFVSEILGEKKFQRYTSDSEFSG